MTNNIKSFGLERILITELGTMVFKFKKLKRFCVGWILVISFFLGFSVAAEAREGIKSTVLILVMFVLPITFSGFAVILNMMDIVVSEQGVSRNFFGVTWQSIDWTNVKIIKIFDISNINNGKNLYFNIFPKNTPKFRIIPSGKIIFNDNMINFPNFRKLMNEHIKTNDIKIERTIKGVTEFINQMP